MADEISNGSTAVDPDVEMKEEISTEPAIGTLPPQVPPTQDPTDPHPPPQSQPQTSILPEHLSTITPSAPAITSTPPPPLPLPAATSTQRPGSIPPKQQAMPEKAVSHGGPTRRYLNENVTPHLLEAMKYLAAAEPDKPLAWLSDFLKERSREVEG